MNIAKLGKQLKREIKAHPGKCGVLALVVVVAVWFWVPLIMSWTSHGENTPPAATPATSTAATNTAAAPTPTQPVATGQTMAEAPPTTKETPWQDLSHWITKDAMTRPAGPLRKGRDPFCDVAVAVTETEKKPAAPKQEQIDPKDLGLTLSSTLVGSDVRIATINGRAYRMTIEDSTDDEPVTVVVERQGKPLELTLISIEPDQVLLGYHGQQFPIQLKEKKLNAKSTVELHGGEPQ